MSTREEVKQRMINTGLFGGITREQAEAALVQMNRTSNAFYVGAVKSGVHAFIEFTGLMNEYIKICEEMTAEYDFSWHVANIHSQDDYLKFQPHHAAYLAEKLDCIYGKSLRSSEAIQRAFAGEQPKNEPNEGKR